MFRFDIWVAKKVKKLGSYKDIEDRQGERQQMRLRERKS